MPYDANKSRYNTSDDEAFGGALFPITPGAGDQVDANGNYFKYMIALTAGDVTVLGYKNADGDTPQTITVAAGQVIPLRVRRVITATGTVAGVQA